MGDMATIENFTCPGCQHKGPCAVSDIRIDREVYVEEPDKTAPLTLALSFDFDCAHCRSRGHLHLAHKTIVQRESNGERHSRYCMVDVADMTASPPREQETTSAAWNYERLCDDFPGYASLLRAMQEDGSRIKPQKGIIAPSFPIRQDDKNP